MLGPEGSCYEGGAFEVELTIGELYPSDQPPGLRFITPIYSPFVDSVTGEVHFD